MKLTTIFSLIGVSLFLISCEKKEETPQEPAKESATQTSKPTAKETNKPAQKSSNPHINATQQIGEKLEKAANQNQKILDDAMSPH